MEASGRPVGEKLGALAASLASSPDKASESRHAWECVYTALPEQSGNSRVHTACLQIPLLVQSGYRVVAPDLKGFGQSDKPQDVVELYTMPNLLKDVLSILEQLEIHKVYCVVGHDWGSALAWQLAGRFPDRFQRLAALSVGHNASMFSMGGNKQREKSWYMLFFKVSTQTCLNDAD